MKNKINLTVCLFIILLVGLWLTGCSISSNQPSEKSLQMAMQDMLDGFDKIEKDVNKGDYNSARQEYKGIHAEFHAVILEQLNVDLGKVYGDKVHGKIGILEARLFNNDKSEIIREAIQLNRNSIYKVAKDMEIKLDK